MFFQVSVKKKKTSGCRLFCILD